jgi:DNA-binding NarL/FixJ family response regulator
MSDSRKQGPEDASRLRAMVVEDEFVVSLTLKVQLEAVGCEVVGVAREADSAVQLASQLRPDVILMDIGLPGKSGVEATREIMVQAPTRIIVVTAYGDERVDGALKAGACLALTKPIVEEQLARAVADVVGEARRQDAGPEAGEG